MFEMSTVKTVQLTHGSAVDKFNLMFPTLKSVKAKCGLV